MRGAGAILSVAQVVLGNGEEIKESERQAIKIKANTKL
jgi:hypothetical protein